MSKNENRKVYPLTCYGWEGVEIEIRSEAELVAALDYAKHEMDGEAGHVEADGLLAGFVSALGFHDIANAYACADGDRRY